MRLNINKRLSGRKILNNKYLFIIAIIAIQSVIHLVLLQLTNYWTSLDGDEAIFGIMGAHIAQFKNISLFFYGQAYMGSFEALLHALLFKLFGVHLWALKLSSFIFTAPLAILAYHSLKNLGISEFRSRVITLLVIIPSPFVLSWMHTARGYSAAILLVAISIWLLSQFYNRNKSFKQLNLVQHFQTVLLALGFWVNSLSSLVILPCLLLPFLTKKLNWKNLFFHRLLILVLLLSPVIIYNIATHAQTLKVIAGFSLDLERGKEDVEEFGVSGVIGQSISSKLSGYGEGPFERILRFSSELFLANISKTMDCKTQFPSYLAFFLLMLGIILTTLLQKKYRRKNLFFLAILLIVVLVGFAQQRYAAIAIPLVPIIIGFALNNFRKIYQTIIIIILCSVNVWGIAAKRFDYYDFGKALNVLNENELKAGFSGYWKAYPIVFLSKEHIICSPLGGPNDLDRYPEYSRHVKSQADIFYLYDSTDLQANQLEHYLHVHNISHSKLIIGRNTLYYDFSARILPDDFRSLKLHTK